MQIFVFGASIVYGSWDEEGGWVDRLKRLANQKVSSHADPDYWAEVYNLGVPGQRTDHLLKRFNFETEQRISDDDEKRIFVLQLVRMMQPLSLVLISSKYRSMILLATFEK